MIFLVLDKFVHTAHCRWAQIQAYGANHHTKEELLTIDIAYTHLNIDWLHDIVKQRSFFHERHNQVWWQVFKNSIREILLELP